VFLASDEASKIHGATMPVDGGMAGVFRVSPRSATAA
jgi:hypothetical protein